MIQKHVKERDMAINVTCPNCHTAISVESGATRDEYLKIKETECPICGHEFQMKFVNFFDEQLN